MARVLIAEQSHIIGLGLYNLVKSFQDVEAIKIVANEGDCCQIIEQYEPELLLVNTTFLKPEMMHKVMDLKKSDAILIHVFNTSIPIDAPLNQLSILDTKQVLHQKIEDALNKVKQVSDEVETEELSPRERAILKEVALGLTNKEIAEKTYISTHTVISHRKNITRKLGIKTVSGLTVYAILNNIIQMDDIS